MRYSQAKVFTELERATPILCLRLIDGATNPFKKDELFTLLDANSWILYSKAMQTDVQLSLDDSNKMAKPTTHATTRDDGLCFKGRAVTRHAATTDDTSLH